VADRAGARAAGPGGLRWSEEVRVGGRSDVITLTGLRAWGRHGVYPAERAQGQPFVVDVVLELDLQPAAASDDVHDTVHYGDLAGRLVAVLEGEPVNLIETLAQRLAGECLSDARVAAATVTVHKPRAPVPHELADVAVTIRRARGGYPSAAGAQVPGRQASR
jgi:7,8-dihydroneopterin aldolase/epimerase/oxygenase